MFAVCKTGKIPSTASSTSNIVSSQTASSDVCVHSPGVEAGNRVAGFPCAPAFVSLVEAAWADRQKDMREREINLSIRCRSCALLLYQHQKEKWGHEVVDYLTKMDICAFEVVLISMQSFVKKKKPVFGIVPAHNLIWMLCRTHIYIPYAIIRFFWPLLDYREFTYISGRTRNAYTSKTDNLLNWRSSLCWIFHFPTSETFMS